MNIKLLKKWRTTADEMFFENLSINFKKRIQFTIPEFYTWTDHYGHAQFRQGKDWESFYEDECISVNDLTSELRKSYKDFVDEYVKYMTLKTKEKYPYRNFRIKFFFIKRR